MTRQLQIRISDNVLEEKEWSTAQIAFDELGNIAAICILNDGIYGLPSCVGWSFTQLTKWQSWDATGHHPETYHEIRAIDAEEWHSMRNEHDVRKLSKHWSLDDLFGPPALMQGDFNTEEAQALHIGKRVITVDVLTACRTYTKEGQKQRKPNDPGWIVDYSNGHGLCYAVNHADGVAWYDANELIEYSSH
ncbi:hypothetical protein LCGC14_1401860 [marine sediment metagenome]|uniref:Uncharacterized protein n=1 Tax=marine sediment metagenome TaxID=412755 RepID=A0A0F9KHV3_9ZZZZ